MVSLLERFYSKVDKSSGPNACWPWLGTTNDKGRGNIRIDGRNEPAPKIAWILGNGKPWPIGMNALHYCDNPNCVNDAHIYPGTQYDNVMDRVHRGRHVGNTGMKLDMSNRKSRRSGYNRK